MIVNNSYKSTAYPFERRELPFANCASASFIGGFVAAFVISVLERVVGLLSTYDGMESVRGFTKMDIKAGIFMGISLVLLVAPAMYFFGRKKAWVGYVSAFGTFCVIQAICIPYMNISSNIVFAISAIASMPLISLAGIYLAYVIAAQIASKRSHE